MSSVVLVLLLGLTPGGMTAQQPAVGAPDWTRLTAQLDALVPRLVPGLTLHVFRNNKTIYTHSAGIQKVDSVLPIASSTKMPSASAIFTLVDRQMLDLDRPVREYLRGTIEWPEDKSAITTRMLLNHTSGIAPAAACLNSRTTTLKECVQEIARLPLEFSPGSSFGYGGGSFQVAGYVAEVVSRTDWNTLFTQAIGRPLGLTKFSYGPGFNPRIAGGASSDAADYIRILEMHAAGGVFNGTRVLSTTAIETMRKDQIAGVPKHRSPGGPTLPGYAFGWWISAPAIHPGSRGPELSDQGAFGCTPWIDLDLGYGAVLLIESRLQAGTEIWNEIRPIITEQIKRIS